MYNIDFVKLVLMLVWDLGCTPILLGFVNALIEPVKVLYGDFMKARAADWYQLNHNGQVCYLQAVLNDRFDPDLRRIYIGDGNLFERTYLYTRAEEQPVYLGIMYLHNRTDYADTGVDFIVHAPADIEGSTNIYEFNALVNKYRLASKNYTIVYE